MEDSTTQFVLGLITVGGAFLGWLLRQVVAGVAEYLEKKGRREQALMLTESGDVIADRAVQYVEQIARTKEKAAGEKVLSAQQKFAMGVAVILDHIPGISAKEAEVLAEAAVLRLTNGMAMLFDAMATDDAEKPEKSEGAYL